MERIAEALNTTHKTISKDLENCTQGTNQKRANDTSRPKRQFFHHEKTLTSKRRPPQGQRGTHLQQCRIANEYDAAQKRGEVQTAGGDRKSINVPNKNNGQTVADIGLTRKLVHEARFV
jgi:hypothetical protein